MPTTRLSALICAALWVAAAVSVAGAAAAAPLEERRAAAPLRVLAVVPLQASNSPGLDQMAVAAQLAERGHAVLVLTTSPAAFPYLQRAAARHSSNTTVQGIRFLAAAAAPLVPGGAHQAKTVSPSGSSRVDTWQVPASWWRRMLQGPRLVLAMQDSMAAQCEQMLADEAATRAVRDFQPDLVLPLVLLPTGPSLAKDSCGCVMAAVLESTRGRYVEVDSPLAALWVNPLSTLQFGSGLTPADLQRPGAWLRNAGTWLAMQLLPLWSEALPPRSNHTYAALRARLSLPPAASYSRVAQVVRWVAGRGSRGGGGTRTTAIQCRPLLRVLPGSWLLEHPRSLPANSVLVGWGSPRPARPLRSSSSAEVAEFVESASAHGLVLVGFGTGAVSNDSSWLSLADLRELAAGFATLAPTRVLWNLQGGQLPEGARGTVVLGPNTRLVGWVDYNDVLGHPNTRVFFSHCGLHSATEALYHGVPVIGVPFMFEQAHTCAKLAWHGAAVVSPEAPAFRSSSSSSQGPSQHFTAAGISSLVRQVLQDGRYAEAARSIAAAAQTYAARRQPYQRAADAVELAMAAAVALDGRDGQALPVDVVSSSSSTGGARPDEL